MNTQSIVCVGQVLCRLLLFDSSERIQPRFLWQLFAGLAMDPLCGHPFSLGWGFRCPAVAAPVGVPTRECSLFIIARSGTWGKLVPHERAGSQQLTPRYWSVLTSDSVRFHVLTIGASSEIHASLSREPRCVGSRHNTTSHSSSSAHRIFCHPH